MSREAGRRGTLDAAVGSSRPVVWAIKTLIAPTHRWLFRLTRGRLFGRNILLLTTQGRRTGKPHTNPVFFLRDGRRFVVCNVRPRSEPPNPWVLNLRANPIATVQVRAESISCMAHELSGSDIEYYWPQLVALWPAYREHYERTGERTVFILEPHER